MSTTTTNLGLTLPAGSDPADIAVLNTNFGLIDSFAGQQTAKDTSQDARMTAIENDAADRDDRLTALETSDTSQNGRLTALETSDTSQNGRLTALEQTDTAHAGRLTAIETKNTTQDGRLTALETSDTSQNSRLTALETNDTAQDAAIAGMAPFLSGKKVYEHYFGSTSGSDTFTISKSDFGSGNLTNCGVYLIYRVSWATAPAISIYALAYSGGRVDYTTLQKIAGDDFDISVAQGVLSFTTDGKIQIIAIA